MALRYRPFTMPPCSHQGCSNDAVVDIRDKDDNIIMSLCQEHLDDIPACEPPSEDN